MEKHPQKTEDKEEMSVLQGEGSIFMRILNRDSSGGSSSSSGFLHSYPGNVPFDWETQPGKPKAVPGVTELIPPLTPPPPFSGAESMPRPTVAPDRKKGSVWSRVKLWRKVGKGRDGKNTDGGERPARAIHHQCLAFRFKEGHKKKNVNSPGSARKGFVTPCSGLSLSRSVSSSSSNSSPSGDQNRRHHQHNVPPPSSMSRVHTLAKDLVKWPF